MLQAGDRENTSVPDVFFTFYSLFCSSARVSFCLDFSDMATIPGLTGFDARPEAGPHS
jgi:hypothetical protein